MGDSEHNNTRTWPPNDSPYASGRSFAYIRGGKRPPQPILPGRHRPALTPTLPVLKSTGAPEEEQKELKTGSEVCNSSQAGSEGVSERGLLAHESVSLSVCGNGGGRAPATTTDSPRSVNSANSFETFASDVGEICSPNSACSGRSFFAEAAGDEAGACDRDVTAATGAVATTMTTSGKKIGRAMEDLGVVDRTLYESWKELPWQARLCPRAIEEQEDVRRAFALEREVIHTTCVVSPTGWLRRGNVEMRKLVVQKLLDLCFERSGR